MMKKIVALVVGLVLTGATFVFAATQKAAPRVIKSTQDTTLNYAGVEIFVPAGQAVVLGQDDNGSVVVRGSDMNGVRIGEASISSNGPATVSYVPQAGIVMVHSGNGVLVTDPDGRTAELSQGAAVTARDIRIPAGPTLESLRIRVEGRAAVLTNTLPLQKEQKKPAKQEAQYPLMDENENWIPAFVAESEIPSAAYEQAERDVLETEGVLSTSAPR
ncbi:MAG: hypothetical protein J6Y25_00895 [Elusimicrobiaceae bacterium]|nr:hypothetical protein [Elusimicrobiaceae bacterium]